MPDPLSTTIGAICHVKSSVEALQIYRNLSAQFYVTSVSVLSAKTQFDCIADALDRIRDILLSRPQLAVEWTSNGDLSGPTLQSTMTACGSTFTFITETLYQLTNKSLETCGQGTTRVQFVRLWNASNIEVGLKHVSILIPAMNILQSALISEVKAEMADLLTSERSRAIFAKVACNADRMLAQAPCRPIVTMSNSSYRSSSVSGIDDLDAYSTNNTWFRNAWATAKNRGYMKPMPQQCTMRPEHGHLARAMASFRATPRNPDQLSFKKCDLLEVTGVQDLWWRAKKDTGETGLVPSDYLSLFDARLPMHNDICTRLVKAAYPYVADPRTLGELSFEKGEVMEAYDMKPGWWYAKKRSGESGAVPASYFILDGDARVDTTHSLTSLPLSPPPYSQILKETRHTTYYKSASTAVIEPPDKFSFLDHPPIAQAVWEAPD